MHNKHNKKPITQVHKIYPGKPKPWGKTNKLICLYYLTHGNASTLTTTLRNVHISMR